MRTVSILLLAALPLRADEEFFEKKIRPLLTTHCAECHGEKKQKGGLRLDSRAAALSGGDLGAAIVPGKPDESPLVKAVKYDGDLQMPPQGKLDAAAVADLEKWVKDGAVWPGAGTAATVAAGFTDAMKKHWAFQPLAKVETPPGAAPHPVDRFLEAKAGAVKAAPPAAAHLVARRLSYDLHGLPPSPERVAAFEKDFAQDANAAVAKYIDELQASPHYGERYGRHWLDVARYADTNGSEVDHAMANAWRYRDAVVRSFNADKPWSRFLKEQIAGDLMEGEDALLATGFLMLGPKALADLDKEKFTHDVIDEQLDTIGKAMLGLTIGCARCHDHKFDPILAKDYYALAGILRSTTSLDTSKRVATWTERPLAAKDGPRAAALAKTISELRDERVKLAAQRSAAPQNAGVPYKLFEAENFTKANVRVDRDQLGKGIGVVRTRMEYPDHIEYEFDLKQAGEYQVELRYAAKESRPTQLIVNGNLEEMEAAAEVTGDWTPKAQKWFRQGTYTFKEGKNTLAFHRDGPVPLFDQWLIGPVLPEGKKHSDDLKAAPKAGTDDLTKQIKTLDAKIEAAEAECEKSSMAMAPREGTAVDSPVLIRGNPATPGAVAPRGMLSFFDKVPAKPVTGSGRVQLADWIADPANPLTARVIVNRVWLWHFGEGLVRSPDNFGLRGETPSHPELLDWLANWFQANGGSVKKLNVLICTSAAYRQASTPADAKDPENRLVRTWRPQRLDAEQLRDSLLALGGNLDTTVGGTLMEVLNRTYATGGNAPPDVVKRMHYDVPRRSLYLPVVRNALHGAFAVFDFPEPGTVTGQRSRTTVAPQALYLMNSPMVKAQAKRFAERFPEGKRTEELYRHAFGRAPTPDEVAKATAFAKTDGWPAVAHALLMSNEFLYVK